MSLIPVNLTATDAENTDVESFSLQLPDEKEQVNENENMDTEQGADLSIVIPAKRRKSMRASFRPLLPITAVPNIIRFFLIMSVSLVIYFSVKRHQERALQEKWRVFPAWTAG